MKTIVMTGGTAGIGLAAAQQMQENPDIRFLVGARNQPPSGLEVLPLDLTKLASVRSFAAAVKERLGDTSIDGLVLNAGILGRDIRQRTGDGFETTFAVNHLAHYLLLRLLMPRLAPGATVNDRISPTYSVLSRLAQALEIRWPDMVGGKESSFAQGCRAVSRAGQGVTHPTATGVYLWLGTDLVTKMMEPTLIDALADTGKHVLAGHDGEEFIYVTEGKLVFLMRDYAPLSLDVGDSIYFDAATPHACYGLTEAARYLSIVARPRN